MNLSELNSLDDSQARAQLLKCCASGAWADRLAASRPFPSRDALFTCAEATWWALSESDWLEAFNHHPKIGDVASLRMKYAGNQQWSAGEQAGMQSADEETIKRLAKGNKDYEERYGYIFIVCATGRTAAEMLALLESRLANNPYDELRVAAAEQAKITRLRLEKLLS